MLKSIIIALPKRPEIIPCKFYGKLKSNHVAKLLRNVRTRRKIKIAFKHIIYTFQTQESTERWEDLVLYRLH